jgi:hypothetical protein
MAERLRNRLQSDSIPVRIWILAFFLNYLINLNYILRSTFNKFMQCQGGGTATQSPAERFHSSSNLDLGFLLNFPILFPKYLIFLSFLFFSLLERAKRAKQTSCCRDYIATPRNLRFSVISKRNSGSETEWKG